MMRLDNRRYPYKDIDKEIASRIIEINIIGRLMTVASCSGHGKYHPTIVMKHKKIEYYQEFYSKVMIEPTKRRYLCFYKKDESGLCFIPEVEAFYSEHNSNSPELEWFYRGFPENKLEEPLDL